MDSISSYFLGVKNAVKILLCKIIFYVIAATRLKENQVAELAVSIMGHIRKTSHGHVVSILCISGTVDIPGCGHRLHPRGVGMPGTRSAGIVHKRDVENYGNLASLGDDNCLPESFFCSLGFGSSISKLCSEIFCFPQ